MSGSIFLMGEDGGLTELREQPYEAEPVLQELLARCPDLLAAGILISTAGSPRRATRCQRPGQIVDVLAQGGREVRLHIDELEELLLGQQLDRLAIRP